MNMTSYFFLGFGNWACLKTLARVSGPQTRALRDKGDREDFLQRLAVLCQEGNLIVYAVQRRSCR